MRWPVPLLRRFRSGSRGSTGADPCRDPFIHDALPLLARLCVGMIFWRSGQTKLDGWHVADSAVSLFQTEYRLPLIDPWLAASLSAFNENVFSVLLVVGLATRVAALVLLGTTLVIEVFVYPDAWPIHGTWAVSLVLVLVRGAGIVSLDRLITSWRRHVRRDTSSIPAPR